jgi:hypothetical protein
MAKSCKDIPAAPGTIAGSVVATDIYQETNTPKSKGFAKEQISALVEMLFHMKQEQLSLSTVVFHEQPDGGGEPTAAVVFAGGKESTASLLSHVRRMQEAMDNDEPCT